MPDSTGKLTPLERVQEASARNQDKLLDSLTKASAVLNRYQTQERAQAANPNRIIQNIDSDLLRGLVGSVNKGTGGVIEGLGRSLDPVAGNPEELSGLGALLQPGLKSLGKNIADQGQAMLDTRDAETLYNLEQTQIKGDPFKPSTWDFGSNPNVAGYSTQMLEILGQFAPQSLGLLTKSPQMGAGIASGVGFLQAGNSQAQEAEKYINGLDEATLAKLPEYQKLLKGSTPEAARAQLAQTASQAAFNVGGAIGGLGGGLTNKILRAPAVKTFKGAAGAVGLSALEEGSQELAETVGSRAAVNAVAGTSQDITKDTLADLILGAGFGGGLKGAGVAAQAVKAGAVKRQEKRAEENRIQAERDRTVAEDIKAANFDGVVKKAQQGDYDIDEAAALLNGAAKDKEITPENRQAATNALIKLENSISSALNKAQKIKDDPDGFFAEQRKDPEELAQLVKDNIAILEPQETEEKAKLEQQLSQFEADIAAINAREEAFKAEGLGPDHNDQIAKYKAQLDSIAQMRQTAEADLSKDVGAETIEQQIEAVTSEDTAISKPAAIKIIERIKNDPDSLDADNIDLLASNPNFSPAQQTALRKLADAKIKENALKNIDDVADNIFKDNKHTGYIGLPNYKSGIGTALRSGDIATAQSLLKQLESFKNDHRSKAEAVKAAMTEVGPNKSQQVVLRNTDKTWFNRANTKELGKLSDKQVRENGGLTISAGTPLSKFISDEADILEDTYEAMQVFVNETASKANSTKKTTPNVKTRPKIEEKSVTDQTKAKKTAKTESKVDNAQKDIKEVPKVEEEPIFDIDPNQYDFDQDNDFNPNDVADIARFVAASKKDAKRPKAKTIDPVRDLTELLQSDPEGVELFKVIEWVEKNGTEAHKRLISKFKTLPSIRSLGKVTNKKEVLKDAEGEFVPGGTYDLKNHKVNLYPQILIERGGADITEKAVNTVVHEVIHAFTATYIENNPNSSLVAEIKEIIAESKEWLAKDDNKENINQLGQVQYALTSPHELLAVVLSNPRVSADFGKIPSNKGGTVLDRFMSAIKKLVQRIAGSTPVPDSLLDRILAVSTEFIKADVATNTSVAPEISFLQENEKVSGAMNQNQLFNLNRIAAYFTISGNTALSKVNGFISNVIGESVYNLEVLEPYVKDGQKRLDKFEANGNPVPLLRALTKHAAKWDKDIDRLHAAKGTDKNGNSYRWQAPLDFMLDPDGRINKVMKDAMSVAAFDFAMENHNDLWFNLTEEEKRGVLNLKDSEELTAELSEFAQDSGSRDNGIILEIGKAAYQAAGYKLNKDAPKNEEQLVIGALGSMGLSLLLDSGYMQRIELDATKLDPNADKHAKHYFIRSNRIFNKELGKFEKNETLEKFKVLGRGNQGILNDIFGMDHKKTQPTLHAVKTKQKTVKNGDMELSKEQIGLINEANAKKYKLKSEMLDPETGLLTRLSRETFADMAGAVNLDKANVHIVNRLSVQARNEAIEREIDLIDQHIKEINEGQVDKEFHIQHTVWKQFRVGQDSSTINPQSSKIHRNLINIGDWSFDVDINKGTNLQTFKLAVIEALGGKTDAGTVPTVIKAFDTVLQDPVYMNAVGVINSMIDEPSYVPSDAEEGAIRAAVKKGGEALHSYVGLAALAKYDKAAAKDGKFTTDIHREGDGKTNGPMILFMQMGITGLEVDDNRFGNMGGFFEKKSPHKSFGHYSELNKDDIYKYVAKTATGIMLDDLKENPKKANKYALLEAVMGDLMDNTKVTGDARNAVKNPVTVTIFGAGEGGTMNSMGDGFIEAFYAKLEEYEDTNKLKEFIRIANTNLPKQFKIPVQESYLEYKLTPKQKEIFKSAIKKTFSGAVMASINEHFGTLLSRRAVINDAVNMTARMYMATYDAEVRKYKAEAKQAMIDAGQKPVVESAGSRQYEFFLSEEQNQEIADKLAHLFPSINTFFSKRDKGNRPDKAGIAGIKTEKFTSGNKATRAEINFNNLAINDGTGTKKFKTMTYDGLVEQLTEPGVGIPILTAHSMDSYVAMAAYAKMNVLNNHDAVTGSAVEISEAMQLMNKAMFDALMDYSIPEEVMKTTYRVMDEFDGSIKEYANDPDFQEALENIVPPIILDDGTIVPVDYKEEAYKMLETANLAHIQKLNYLAELGIVDQYYIEGGAYTVPASDSAQLDVRRKNETLFSVVGVERSNTPGDPIVRTVQQQPNATVNIEGDIAQTDETIEPLPNNGDLLAAKPYAGPNTLEYTTLEVFDALDQTNPTVNAQYLRNMLASVTSTLYGPLGAKKALVQSATGESAVDLVSSTFAAGLYPFVSAAQGKDLAMSQSEYFVLEQLELTAREVMYKNNSAFSYKELVKVFREARNKIEPKAFHNGDWATATRTEKNKAQAIHDFIFKIDNSLNQNGSDHLSRFAALSVAYTPLHQAMQFSTAITPKKTSTKLGDRLVNLYTTAIEFMTQTTTGTIPEEKANVKVEKLLQRLVYNERKYQLNLESRGFDYGEQIDRAFEAAGKPIRKGAVKFGESAFFQKSKIQPVKLVGNVISTIADDKVEELFHVLQKMRNDTLRNRPLGFMNAVAQEYLGETKATSAIFDLLAGTNHIEQERKSMIENLSSEVLSQLEKGDSLTDEEKSAITQVFLRSDLSSLLDKYTISEISNFVTDTKARNAQIATLRKELNKFTNASDYNYAVDDLGYFLATGNNTSAHLFKNAHNIANLYGMGKTVSKVQADAAQPVIDEISSLIALNYTDPAMLDLVKATITTEGARGDANGLQYILRMHQNLQKDALTQLFHGSPTQLAKGYTKELYNPHNTVIVADKSEHDALEKAGYVYVQDLSRDVTDVSPATPARAMYKLEGVGLKSFETGIISYTGMRHAGSSAVNTISTTNATGTKIRKMQIVGSIQAQRARLINSRPPYTGSYDPAKGRSGQLAPVFAPNGSVANYHYLMNHQNKDIVMERDNRVESILANVAANQYDKMASQEHNKLVIQALYDFYRDDSVKNPHAYVDFSLNSKQLDQRETYRLLPEATKRAIKDIWGNDRMYIRNDLLDLVTGYRNISLTDPFGRDQNSRHIAQNFLIDLLESVFGKAAAIKLRKAENLWESVVKLVKDIVIIRNLKTLVGNVVSNVSTLVWYGVPLKEIGRSHKEVIDGLIRQQQDSNELIKLENRVKNTTAGTTAHKQLVQRVAELKHGLKANVVHELVEAGLFQSIVEDVDADTSDAYFKDAFNTAIEDNLAKLPKAVKTGIDVALVRPNTTIYKLLSKGTQMSDFVARYTLYKHLVSEGMPKKEAISEIRQAFVNYDVPTNKYLNKGNMLGLVMFTKYNIRIQKILFKLMREKPARGLMLAMIDNYITSLPSIMESNVLGSIGDNPLQSGAFNIFNVADEPVPIKILLNILD